MAKKKPQRRWVYAPRKPTPPPVPEALKAEVQAQADELIEAQLKPRFIEFDYRCGGKALEVDRSLHRIGLCETCPARIASLAQDSRASGSARTSGGTSK